MKSEEQMVFDEFAIRLKHIRGFISQEDFAHHLGVSAKHISELENGKTLPSAELLVRICIFCKVSPAYLLPLPPMEYRARRDEVIDNLSRGDDKLLYYFYQIALLHEKDKR